MIKQLNLKQGTQEQAIVVAGPLAGLGLATELNALQVGPSWDLEQVCINEVKTKAIMRLLN